MEARVTRPSDPVVVTGTGVISSIGDRPSLFLDALLEGRSGVVRWPERRAGPYSKIGGDLSSFDLAEHLRDLEVRYGETLCTRTRRLLRTSPFSTSATAAAAIHAYHDAGLDRSDVPPEEMAHVLGGHNLNGSYLAQNIRSYYESDPDDVDPLFGVLSLDSDVLAVTSAALTLKGPAFTIGGACASGALAVLAAHDLIRTGRARVVIVTGGAFDTDPVLLHAWAQIDAISWRSFNDEPARASRPFDLRREGFVPAQAAAALVLEARSHARARGASVYAELLGGASCADASRLTRPNEEGQVRVMRTALATAGRPPHEVDYVNAHATSTLLGDAVEVAALKRVLGERAYSIPINSTKSLIGHTLAAAGVVEAVATVLQMKAGRVHATLNQETVDPELGLDFVPNQSRPHEIHLAVSNSFGFGGINCCLVFGSESSARHGS